MIPHSEWNKYVFIFAGKVYKDIREEFYLHYNVLKQNIRILVFDEFCSFDFIESLCVSCDAILLLIMKQLKVVANRICSPI